jgi:drug/metabolite transporter (DMT)-like permease
MTAAVTSEGVHIRTSPLRLAAALGTVYVAWGSTYLAIGVMVEEMPPLLGSGTRALAAGGLLALGLMAWGGGGRLRVTRAQLASCAVVGLLLPVAGQGLVTIAEDEGAPSGLTALLVAAVPLWVACLHAVAGRRPSATSAVGMVIGFAGAALLIARHGVHGSAPAGALLLVGVASMSWAFGSWLTPRLPLPENSFVVVVYEMLVGGTVLCLSGWARGEQFAALTYSARAWAAWAFLVVVGSVVALSAYNWLLRTTSVSIVATYAYVNPVIAVWLGWLVLGEPVTRTTLLGAATVVSGVALVVTAERRPS